MVRHPRIEPPRHSLLKNHFIFDRLIADKIFNLSENFNGRNPLFYSPLYALYHLQVSKMVDEENDGVAVMNASWGNGVLLIVQRVVLSPSLMNEATARSLRCTVMLPLF